jgi:hypothetical protein
MTLVATHARCKGEEFGAAILLPERRAPWDLPPM